MIINLIHRPLLVFNKILKNNNKKYRNFLSIGFFNNRFIKLAFN